MFPLSPKSTEASNATAKPCLVDVEPKGRISKWVHNHFPNLYWALTVPTPTGLPSGADYDAIEKEVLESDAVRVAVRRSSEIEGVTTAEVEKKAKKLLSGMESRIFMPLVRLLALLMVKVWVLLFPFGVRVDETKVEELRQLAKEGHPLVLLPNHQSHIDYCVLTYICLRYQICSVPHVIAGANLNVPIVGRILRASGAIFVRRRFGPDPLYRALFDQYIKKLLLHGAVLECFIEGGRSRSGKVLPPKIGFLQTLVSAAVDLDCKDVYVVPMSLGYDRIVESEAHITELQGGKKKAERLMSMIYTAYKLLTQTLSHVVCFGRIDIGIGSPICIGEYIESNREKIILSQNPIAHNKAKFASPGNLEIEPDSPVLTGNEENRVVVRFSNASVFAGPQRNQNLKKVAYYLGYRVLYECNLASTVLPSALLGTVLLTQYERGITYDELVERVVWLKDQVVQRGGRVSSPQGDTVEMILTKVLSRRKVKNQLVKRHKNMLMLSLWTPQERMELSAYRNQLIHNFVSEGLIACAIYACEKDTGGSIPFSLLSQRVKYLSQLLKYEFIFTPQPLVENFEQAVASVLEDMEAKGIITAEEGDTRELKVNEAKTETYLFLCALFWPFMDSYFICVLSFYRLLPDRLVNEQLLVDQMQRIGERLYFTSYLDLYEAISKETLQNALGLFENWKVIEFATIEGNVAGAGLRVVRLKDEWRHPEQLEKLVRQVALFRKRCRGFRSRRFKNKVVDESDAAIDFVKRMDCASPSFT